MMDVSPFKSANTPADHRASYPSSIAHISTVRAGRHHQRQLVPATGVRARSELLHRRSQPGSDPGHLLDAHGPAMGREVVVAVGGNPAGTELCDEPTSTTQSDTC